MGIRFFCPNGHKLNVKEFQAGRRGICPFCGASVQIPTESTRPSSRTSKERAVRISTKGAPNPPQIGTKPSPQQVSSAGPEPNPQAPQPQDQAPESQAQAPQPASQSGPPPLEIGQNARPSESASAAPVPNEPAQQPPTATVQAQPVEPVSPQQPAPAETPSPGTPATPETASSPPSPPPESAAVKSEAVDPLDEAPDAVWYVRPATGGQFGPATADVMRGWITEGRVVAGTLVWCEGWPDWQDAAAAIPQLAANPPMAANPLTDIVTDLGSTAGGSTRPLGPPTRRRSSGPNIAVIVLLLLVVIALLFVFFYVVVK